MTWSDPQTWAALSEVTADDMNREVRDNFKAIGDPWQSYSPAWSAAVSNPSIGNGSLVGNYLLAGKLVHFRITVIMGSTTNFGSGSYAFSLPVGAAHPTTSVLNGAGICFDSSASARRMRFLYLTDANNIRLMDADGAQAATNVPFTWATGDTLYVAGSYEAA